MARTSHYLPMRDGERIAIDVHLPANPSTSRAARLPTILHQTRYMRSVHWRKRWADSRLARTLDGVHELRSHFLDRGYAWVDVDVRGSGASTGYRPCPWWRDEIHDGAEVVDWIVSQPWSNGRVGATGVSYAGTCAEMLMVNQHPAVKAVIPRFSLHDVFADVAFPGGVHLTWFTENWSRFNRYLDENRFHQATARMLQVNLHSLGQLMLQRDRQHLARALHLASQKPLLARALAALTRSMATGVTPIAGAEPWLLDAIRAHENNVDVHQGALDIQCRDDRDVVVGWPKETIDSFSPHAHHQQITGSGSNVLSYSGWLDGAYCHAAVKRFANGVPENSWLILGPWDHGGNQHISPHRPGTWTPFDHDREMVRFMDAFLRENAGPLELPRVRYYTMGEERWKHSETWPPPEVGTERWYLAPGRSLRTRAPERETGDDYRVDTGVGTGSRSRWRTLLGLKVPLGYGDRRHLAPRMVTYTGPALDRDLVVTGHPIAHIYARCAAADGALFAYLEDVAPGGRVTYVTEGQLRFLHRDPGPAPYRTPGIARAFTRAHARPLEPGEVAELRFSLLPVSYRFRAGHAIRLSLACADIDHFAPLFRGGEHLRFLHGGRRDSRLELPVEGAMA